MSVTRLKGKNIHGNSYTVSVFTENGKIARIETCGNPHRNVAEMCSYLERIHTSQVIDAERAIKFTMAKNNEYQGETP